MYLGSELYAKPYQITQSRTFSSLSRFFFFTTSTMLPGERAAVPIPPPPETEWYNGRLDRYSAEQRLKSAYKMGSYLGEFFFADLRACLIVADNSSSKQCVRVTESLEAMC